MRIPDGDGESVPTLIGEKETEEEVARQWPWSMQKRGVLDPNRREEVEKNEESETRESSLMLAKSARTWLPAPGSTFKYGHKRFRCSINGWIRHLCIISK